MDEKNIENMKLNLNLWEFLMIGIEKLVPVNLNIKEQQNLFIKLFNANLIYKKKAGQIGSSRKLSFSE